jgi:hypothetical protein
LEAMTTSLQGHMMSKFLKNQSTTQASKNSPCYVWLLRKFARTSLLFFLPKYLPIYLHENKRTGQIFPIQNCHQLSQNLFGEACHYYSKTKKKT